MAKFKWKGVAPQGADADEVGQELERIRQESADGQLHAEDVVEACRDQPDHPLYKFFNWDDADAAEAHRQNQARGLIRRLRIIHGEAGEPQVVKLAYVSPSPSRKPGYVLAEDALADPVQREQVLRNALAVLRGWQQRYAALEELADEAAAVAEVIDGLETKTKKKAKVKAK